MKIPLPKFDKAKEHATGLHNCSPVFMTNIGNIPGVNPALTNLGQEPAATPAAGSTATQPDQAFTRPRKWYNCGC